MKSDNAGSFDFLKSAFHFRSGWRIFSLWKACVENHHFRLFLSMITNSVQALPISSILDFEIDSDW